jgi:hypothetical protein
MNAIETREDRERLVSSLGIPADAEAPSRYIEQGGPITGPALAALVDLDVAGRTWRRWNPEQAGRLAAPEFLGAFEALLSGGAGMGYSLERFRSASRALPALDSEGDNWVEPFERAVVARNALDLNVHLRPEIRDSFLATNDLPEKAEDRWDPMVSMMSDGLFYELGIVLPRIELLADNSLTPTQLRIEVNDAHLPPYLLLPADRALVNDTVARLKLLNLQSEEAVNPANGTECAIVAASEAEQCRLAGLTTWSRMGHAILTISAVARGMAGAFINRHLVDFYSTELDRAFPVAVQEMKNAMSGDAIAQVLRALVNEGISVRNLPRIFEVLTLPEASIIADLARHIIFSPPVSNRSQFYRDGDRQTPVLERHIFRVRASMARYISHKYTRGQNTLIVYLLDPALEKRLAYPRQFSRREHAALVSALREEVEKLPRTTQLPVILTTASVRLRLRRDIAAIIPQIAVLAYQELSPDMNIQPILRIDVPELSDVFARLKPQEEDGSSRAAVAQPPDDVLVSRLVSAKDQVIADATRSEFGDYATPLASECLEAILGELGGKGTAAKLADALPSRADGPVEWHRVIELVLTLGQAASTVIEPAPTMAAEARGRLHSDRSRIRNATHRLARAIADSALVPGYGVNKPWN